MKVASARLDAMEVFVRSTVDKRTVLVVDDIPQNIDVLTETLQEYYRIRAARSGRRAIEVATTDPRPDIILLDVAMPEMDGYEVCQALKAHPSTARIPVIFVTAHDQAEDEARGLELGAVDYITKPIRPAIVRRRVQTHIALYVQQQALEDEVNARTRELQATRLQVIQRLGRAAEFKDNETGLHVIRMSHYSRLLAETRTQHREWAELVLSAAPMHDIGKIGVPDRILLKNGPLDSDEWRVMRKHPEMGAEIIGDQPSALLKTAREIALTHHEKWDGSGYPRGLRGEEIPLSGRIVAIADVFDALTTRRPYKDAWEIDDAVQLIQGQAGTHFDPSLVALFLDILPQVLRFKERYGEPNE